MFGCLVRARLAKPDVVALLTPNTDVRAAEMEGRAKGLRQRLETVEADYDAGLIDGRRFQTANEKLGVELRAVEVERVTLLAGSAVGGILGAVNPVAAFDQAGLGSKRALIDAILDIRVHRARRGRTPFDPESVVIKRKGASDE